MKPQAQRLLDLIQTTNDLIALSPGAPFRITSLSLYGDNRLCAVHITFDCGCCTARWPVAVATLCPLVLINAAQSAYLVDKADLDFLPHDGDEEDDPTHIDCHVSLATAPPAFPDLGDSLDLDAAAQTHPTTARRQ